MSKFYEAFMVSPRYLGEPWGKGFKGKGEKLGEWQLLELSSVTQGKSKGGQPGSENYEIFTVGR